MNCWHGRTTQANRSICTVKIFNTVVHLYLGSLIPRILGHSRPTSDLAWAAQLLPDIGPRYPILRYPSTSDRNFPKLPGACQGRQQHLGYLKSIQGIRGSFSLYLRSIQGKCPPLPTYIGYLRSIRGYHLESLYTLHRSTLPRLFRGIQDWFVLHIRTPNLIPTVCAELLCARPHQLEWMPLNDPSKDWLKPS